MNFIIASTVSAVIVLMSPFMGQLQSFLRRSLSTRNYVLLFGVGVFVAIALAIAFAFIRIRQRRLQRLALLAAAVVFGAAYMWLNGTPYAEVNAVERVHFVEYGLVALLWYRVNPHRRPFHDRVAAAGVVHGRHLRRVAAMVHSRPRRRSP